jgi:hypothetical protein
MLKHRVHATLITLGYPCPVTDVFGVAGRQLRSASTFRSPWRATVDASLLLMDDLEAQIETINKQLRAVGPEHRYMPLLMAVPGIGFVLSYTIAAEIGDIGRFASPKKLCGYTGPMPPRQPVRRSRSPRHADQAGTKVPALGRGAGLPCRLVLPPARACLSGFSRPAGECRLAWAHQPRMSAKPRPRRRPGRGARGPRGTVRGTVSVTLGNGPWNGLAANGPMPWIGRRRDEFRRMPDRRRYRRRMLVLGSIAGALLLEATVRSGTKARRSVAPLPLHTRPSAQEGEKLGASGRSWPDAIAGACAARACPALRSCREASAVTGAARAIVSWGGLRRRWVRAATEDRA